MDKLLNLHEVLVEAAQKPKESPKGMAMFCFRVPQEVKDHVSELCYGAGISPTLFFRQCALTLHREYKPQQDSE